MALASTIVDDALKKNKMPQFLKDWVPSTVYPDVRPTVQDAMIKLFRRNLEQMYLIGIEFCDYMARKYGPESLPEYGKQSAGRLLKLFKLADERKKPSLEPKRFRKLDDHYYYKGVLIALCDHKAMVLVGFLDAYEKFSYSTMKTLLQKYMEILHHSESFTQLTEQMLEALKNKRLEITENIQT